MYDFVHLEMSVNKHTYIHYGQWSDLITKQLHYIYRLKVLDNEGEFPIAVQTKSRNIGFTRNTLEQTYETADINDS